MKQNILFLIFLICLLGLVNCTSNESLLEGSSHESTIEFPELGEKIYVQARTWGLSGNHEEITISTNREPSPSDSVASQKFFTSEIFYKTKGIDTLIVFAPSSSYKEEYLQVIGRVKLLIQPLTSSNDIEDYNRRYVQLGLTKVSIYY